MNNCYLSKKYNDQNKYVSLIPGNGKDADVLMSYKEIWNKI